MRTFEVLVAMQVHAESFAGAEKKAHQIVCAGFTAGTSDEPRHFDTISILKGSKVPE